MNARVRGFAVGRSIDQISTLAAGQATEGFLTAVADIIEVFCLETKPNCDFSIWKSARFSGAAPSLSKRRRKDPLVQWTRVRRHPIGTLATAGQHSAAAVARRLAEFCPVPFPDTRVAIRNCDAFDYAGDT